VLLIDDSGDDAALFEREFARSGRDLTFERVETEATLRGALATARWDVILCDYNLPGFGAMAALAVVQGSGKDIPFIVVSGSVGEETAVEALKAGAHDFVVKDRLARLLPAIGREMREAEVRRERRQAMEDLRRAVQVRDEFLSVASHELRTPLTALDLQVDFALRLLRDWDQGGLQTREALPDQLRAKLERAARQVDRLAALIDNLLDVTLMTSGAPGPH
jgi:signal transduction histidine kinase